MRRERAVTVDGNGDGGEHGVVVGVMTDESGWLERE